MDWRRALAEQRVFEATAYAASDHSAANLISDRASDSMVAAGRVPYQGGVWEDFQDFLPAGSQTLVGVMQSAAMGMGGQPHAGLGLLSGKVGLGEFSSTASTMGFVDSHGASGSGWEAMARQMASGRGGATGLGVNAASGGDMTGAFTASGTGLFNAAATGCFSSGGLTDFLSTGAGAASFLGAALPFLPPEGQKAAGVGLALLKGDPAAILGALTAYLPEELKAAAAVGMAALSGGIAGGVSALIGQFLPPELQAVWGALLKSGLLTDALGALTTVDATSEDPSKYAGGYPPWAARLGDTIDCPTGKGKILAPCATTVLIGKLPAARETDLGKCARPDPDVIQKGESTVLIQKFPAARVYDITTHCGIVSSGLPSVLIGKSAAGSSECMKVSRTSGASMVAGLAG